MNDPLEAQADSVAARVVAGGPAYDLPLAPRAVDAQRVHPTMEPRDGAGAPPHEHFALDTRVAEASHNGSELDTATRGEMEASFGFDFSQVRIHDDNRAGSAARSVGARAFTLGADIFFNRGEFRPQTFAGKRLLAHELTHVTQQASDPGVVRRSGPPKMTLAEVVEKILAERHTIMGVDGMAYEIRAVALDDEYDVMQVMQELQVRLSRAELTAIAEHFVTEITDVEMDVLLRTPKGHALVGYMLLHSGLKPTKGSVMRYYGTLSTAAVTNITGQNFPSGRDAGGEAFDNFCMHAVLGNLEKAVEVPEYAKIVQEKANDVRATEGTTKVLNSHNLKAATELGRARWIGDVTRDRTALIKSLEHNVTASRHKQSDPFIFKSSAKTEAVFVPNPEAMLVGALSDAPAGMYLFGTSVAEHHSVSILFDKHKPGPLTVGSSDYTIYWNDQFTDGAKRTVPNEDPATKAAQPTVSVDDGHGKGRPGTPLAGRGLVEKLFYAAESRVSNPTKLSFWSGEGKDKEERKKDTKKRQESYVGRASVSPEERQRIEKRAIQQRATNQHGMKIWQIIPG